jgi:alpha-ketoglutarate-dependent taurine dioxygenase
MPDTVWIKSGIGIEVRGVTSTTIVDPEVARLCRESLDAAGVVVFPEVHISDDDLLAFSRLLGTVVLQSTGEHRVPEIQTITLDPSKTRKELAGYRQGNFLWHIDGAIDETPQKGTLLTAREVDPSGGDTEFANTYSAFEALPDHEKTEISALRVRHSFAHAQSLANPDASDAQRGHWDRVPERIHPLVWKHRNGHSSLLLGATAAEVVGWPQERSRALLDRLQAWCTQPQFTLRHRWNRGDLVVWDNTGMLHRALPFEPTSLRLMHRTTLQGEEAVGEVHASV